ncbi:cysteine-rich protein 2 [Plakobranchus ocellatus]|uniref:Cysteine-rich protein 1 n=1 Tax=Plakobranchus ocellatus TaxID=259542 RepID=A0AAV4BH54_9GAST|nr:cysteine-rich protein 2 [Plakobranchus ocellatus]
MNKNCAGCGKPVYFAERKTSLGREWHPSCLKCTECGKVLSPGQHAEHKGMPYCHHPCYRALFGPSLLGYGSNISSPANFGPRKDVASVAATGNRASTGSIPEPVLSEESLSYTYSLGRRNKPKHHLVHQNSNSQIVSKGDRESRDPPETADDVKSNKAPASRTQQRPGSYEPLTSSSSLSSPRHTTPSTSSSSSPSVPPKAASRTEPVRPEHVVHSEKEDRSIEKL